MSLSHPANSLNLKTTPPAQLELLPKMPRVASPDRLHQKSFRIKHDDDRFFTRLLSKESSKSGNPSFRVYYGDVSSAVPFTWETRPGTPKHAISDSTPIPPLTPPPSYYTSNSNNSPSKHSRSKLLILHTLLKRMNPNWRKPRVSPPHSHTTSSSLSSPSWSSSSNSLCPDPITTPTRRRPRFSSCGSSFDGHRGMDEVCPSRLSYGIGKDDGNRLQGGSYSALMVKKALTSIFGLRSSPQGMA